MKCKISCPVGQDIFEGGILKYTHLIWDFNGTVLDDVDVSVDAANALLKRCGVSAIPGKEFYRSVFGFPIKDYYERLGIDFEKTSFEDLAPVWVEEYLSRAPRAGMNEGVLQTIAKVRAMGVSQILLSATEADMLGKQLDMLDAKKYFDNVYGLDNIHAVSKKKRAQEWCAENPNAKPLFLGDTDHDFEVAKATGNDCVLFSGGHQSKEHLLTLGCPVIDDIRRVTDYLV